MELMIIFNIIAIACIGVLLQIAEPIIYIKRWLDFKEEEYDSYSKFKKFVHRLLYCVTCLSFWVSYFITFDVYMASIISILATLLNKIIF
jgi:hypothetical protein